LSKESILQASKERRDDSELGGHAKRQSEDEGSDEEATVAKFLTDVG